MSEGLSHITFIVRDLDKAANFLVSIFDAKEIYSSGEQTFSIAPEKFFLINGIWIAVMEGEARLEKTYDHVAFKVSEKDFDMYAERVRALGVEIKKGRRRVPGEGRSLYFYDFDNHLFELHTGTLEQRLKCYGQG